MSTLLIVLIVLLLLGAGVGPWWGGSPTGWHGYGWYPASGVGIVVIILIILALTGRL